MTLKNHAKFEEKLTYGLEKTWGIQQISLEDVRKRKNWDFDEILLSKVENVWA